MIFEGVVTQEMQFASFASSEWEGVFLQRPMCCSFVQL